MKKVLLVLLSAIMLFALCACSNSNEEETTAPSTTAVSTTESPSVTVGDLVSEVDEINIDDGGEFSTNKNATMEEDGYVVNPDGSIDTSRIPLN